MEKIAKLALKAKGFEDAVIDAVIEVVNATPNKEVALEMILGIYEKPVISDKPNNDDFSRKNAILLSFNPLEAEREQITYQYEYEDKTFIAWPKGTMTDTEAVLKFKEAGYVWPEKPTDDYDYIHARNGKMQIAIETCSINKWYGKK